jgi:hypothetical protein
MITPTLLQFRQNFCSSVVLGEEDNLLVVVITKKVAILFRKITDGVKVVAE